MAVELRIESNGLFKKRMTLEQLSGELSSGVMNENCCLDLNQAGDNIIIYDPSALGRGIEANLFHGGNGVCMKLPLPAAENEIVLFYQLAEKACTLLGSKSYLRDGDKVLMKDSAELVKLDRQASVDALLDISSKVITGAYQFFMIFGTDFPLSIGKEEVKRIDNDLNRFGQWLNQKQQIDAYYANPRVYQRNDGSLFGIYAVSADVPSIIPTKPYLVMKQDTNIQAWYCILGKNSTIVKYDDLIASITGEHFDANHILINISQQEADCLAKNHSVSI